MNRSRTEYDFVRHRRTPQYAFVQCGRCATTFVCSGASPSIRCPRLRSESAKTLPQFEKEYTRFCDLCGVYNDTSCGETRCSHSRRSSRQNWACMLQLPDCCKKKVYQNYMQMWDIVVSYYSDDIQI